MRGRNIRAMVLAGVAWLAAGVATADSPYLKPNVHDATGRDHVTVEASFTEDIFQARVVMRSDFFHVIGPNGETPIADITYLRDMAVFEVATPVDGTYRISSGPRAGRSAKMYRATDGSWKMVGEEDSPPPADAALVDVQSITVAEVYVTRGAPSDGALEPRGQGLELFPMIHPADITAGEDATFQMLFDGRPLTGVEVTVFREAGRYDGKKIEATLTTDAQGRFTVRAGDAGAYLTQVRYRTASPAGAPTPYRSYTHTLAFVANQG